MCLTAPVTQVTVPVLSLPALSHACPCCRDSVLYACPCCQGSSQEGTIGSATDETAHNSTQYPSQLDYGIYWFGEHNKCQKFSWGGCR